MAKTAERKSRSRGASTTSSSGSTAFPGALIFDDLTFTLATGEPIRGLGDRDDRGHCAIKRDVPGVLTSLGVSNVSFGLKPAARAALNSRVLAPLR